MENKTSRDEFNRSAKKPVKTRNYSHKEVLQKLENYSSVAKTKQDKDKMEGLKKDYIEKQEKKPLNRFIRARNFQMGQRAMLHSDRSLDQLSKEENAIDQQERNQTMRHAKDFYHRNYSLSKNFTERIQTDKLMKKNNHKPTKPNKGMDKSI